MTEDVPYDADSEYEDGLSDSESAAGMQEDADTDLDDGINGKAFSDSTDSSAEESDGGYSDAYSLESGSGSLEDEEYEEGVNE